VGYRKVNARYGKWKIGARLLLEKIESCSSIIVEAASPDVAIDDLLHFFDVISMPPTTKMHLISLTQ
jgi:hypothetical protein